MMAADAAESGSHYATGVADFNKKDYRSALAHFQSSLAQGNGSAANYIYMGHCYSALGNPREAVKMYRKVEYSFKDTPAAKMAVTYIQKVDPKGLFKDVGVPANLAGRAGNQSANSSVKPNDKSKSGRGPSFVNRVNVISPSIPGHPPVSGSTVGAIRALISRLPSTVYGILDESGANIHIATNITDKWPEKGSQSKPGMERMTLAQDHGLTDGRDIYIFERASIDVFGKDLREPISPEDMKDELYCQLGHVINNAMRISTESEFTAKYDADKTAMNEVDKRREKFYLQPDGKGAAEVCATSIAVSLGAGPYRDLDRCFPKTKEWVRTRMEQEYRARSLAATAHGARPVPGRAGARGTAGATTITPPSSASTDDSDAPTLSMPAEEHIPYNRHQGDHLYVHGQINGRPTEILIDTGAFKVVVGKQDLLALGIKPPEGARKLIGAGASGALYGWEMPLEISIGRIKRKLTAQILDGRQPMLLGQPFLRGMHYQIDRSRSYIHFIRDAKDLEKQIGYNSVAIPFRMIDGNMMVEAKINGIKTEMNFDTGAPFTLLAPFSIYQFNLTPLGRTQIGGAGGSQSSAMVCHADTVELGPIRKTGVQLVVGSAVGHNVLGQDFFGHMKFIVDNEKQVILIAR